MAGWREIQADLQSPPPRYNVQGVAVSALTLGLATRLVLSRQGKARSGYVCVTTVHGICEARADASFRSILNRSFLTTPDGMPLVWLGPRGVTRVYGPDLMEAVCDQGRTQSLRHFLFGGAPGVAGLLAQSLARRFPGIEIAGTYTPPYRPLDEAEWDDLSRQVAAAKPDIIWVGISTPKQERFMAEAARRLEVPLLIGVGAAFDFFSGRVRQAPRWIQRSGFEWLFRLCAEPRRLGPRYLKTNPLFLLRALGQSLGLVRYPIDPPSA